MPVADDCLDPDDSNGRDVPFGSAIASSSSTSLPSETQTIITSYKFKCQGNVTGWWTYIVPPDAAIANDLQYTITFQVWRPSEDVETDGCYSLVGSNTFSGVTVSQNGLVSGIPSESDMIQVAAGDVVGYYTIIQSISTGVELDEGRIKLDDSYHDEKVWYHTNTEEDPLIHGSEPCIFPIGTNGILNAFTTAAPILTLEIGWCHGCMGIKGS